ncbi:MAG: ATP-binding protein [Gammaproteobacteria bacterium]
MGRDTLVRRLAHLGDRRQDAEHEQAFIRVGIAIAYLAYVVTLARLGIGSVDGITDPVVVIGAAFALLACGWVMLIAYRPNPSAARRIIALVADIATLSAAVHYLESYGVPLFPVYLWVAVGNGFRYGGRYLLAATALGLAGFLGMAAATPFWRDQQTLMAGMVIVLSVVPLYVWRMLGQINTQRRRAQAANQAKSRFLANMSHELRTPLNAVIGLSHLLEIRALDGQERELVRDIHESALTLGALVDEVLDFAKIEEARITLEDNPFDLYELLASVWHMFRRQAEEKGLRLLLDVDLLSGFTFRGDASRLRQVVINLVGNAIKFTDRGRVVVRLRGSESGRSGRRWRFEVVDTGVGIEEQAQAHIFERFRQADDSTARRFGGTGLGITISKQLVELMGGRIGVRSSPGSGSCFWFEVELRPEVALHEAVSMPLGTEAVVYPLAPIDEQDLLGRLRALGATSVTLCRSRGELVNALERKPDGHRPHWVWVAAGSCEDAAALALPAYRWGEDAEFRQRWLLLAPDPFGSGRDRALEAGYSVIVRTPVDAGEFSAAAHLAAALQERALAADGQSDVRARATQGVRVLVGEDNRINQLVIRRVLEEAGYRPEVVGSGAALLAELGTDRYALAIVDIQMPDLSGLEAVSRHRATSAPDVRGTAIVVLTADATRESQEAAYLAGADYFLTKPVEPDRLLEVVAAALAAAGEPERVRQAP